MAHRSLLSWLWLVPALAGAQGFRVEPGQLVVGPSHWASWQFPQGTLEIGDVGVRPAHIQSTGNAVPQAVILAAGSNPAAAPHILDGDPATYWEPDLKGSPESWWVQIDLGRTVSATRISLRFAEEGRGDPFYQFNVLTSNGTPAFSGAKSLAFNRIGRTEQPNTAQRLFSFPLNPLRPADQGFTGDPIRFVLIQVTDSRGDRAEELPRERYEALAVEQQGAIEYYRREASGRERLVDREQYQALAEESRGSVKYYRRELPRLTDIEVLTAGDNLALSILQRGGKLEGFGSLGSEVLIADGDFTTVWATPSAYADPTQEPDRNLFIDLGAMFWLNRLQFMYVVTPASGPFPNYVMKVSDGSRAPDGSLVWTPVAAQGVGAFNVIGAAAAPDQEIREYQAILFPLTKVRFFKLDYQVQVYFGCAGLGCSATMREVQFYGEGFLPEVILSSPVIELGARPRTLATIEWDAQIPEGTQLQVRTRTGNQLEQKIRYFNKSGGEVTEAQYRKLLSFQRGDSLVTFVTGADWSNWSQFYEGPGARITSPSPRRFLMIQAALRSDRPEQSVLLRGLKVKLEDPLASALVGEIAPERIATTGKEQPLTLYLRPSFQPGDPGFDQLLLTAPRGTSMSLLELRIGAEEAHRDGIARRLGPEELRLIPTAPDSVWIVLPETIARDQLLALRFSAVLFSASNVFEVAAGSGSGAATTWQRVDAGEATVLGDGSGLNVLAPFAERILRGVQVRPNPFTPNQDGLNEVQTFAFSVFKISGEKTLFLEIYDLSGRRMRRLEQTLANPVGEQRLEWDGRDAEGHLVAPGLYLGRFGLDADAAGRAGTTATRVVGVVY